MDNHVNINVQGELVRDFILLAKEKTNKGFFSTSKIEIEKGFMCALTEFIADNRLYRVDKKVFTTLLKTNDYFCKLDEQSKSKVITVIFKQKQNDFKKRIN